MPAVAAIRRGRTIAETNVIFRVAGSVGRSKLFPDLNIDGAIANARKIGRPLSFCAKLQPCRGLCQILMELAAAAACPFEDYAPHIFDFGAHPAVNRSPHQALNSPRPHPRPLWTRRTPGSTLVFTAAASCETAVASISGAWLLLSSLLP